MLAHKLLNKDEVLDNELRGRIMDYLVSKPGSYLGKIGRDLDVPTSTLKYHLNIMRAFDFITAVKKGRCRHYFPRRRRFSDLEKRMYATIEHAPTRRIVEIVNRQPGISQAGLVRETGLSQSTVAWHMAKLEEMNLIRSQRNEVKEYYVRDLVAEALRRAAAGEPVVPAASPLLAPRPLDAMEAALAAAMSEAALEEPPRDELLVEESEREPLDAPGEPDAAAARRDEVASPPQPPSPAPS